MKNAVVLFIYSNTLSEPLTTREWSGWIVRCLQVYLLLKLGYGRHHNSHINLQVTVPQPEVYCLASLHASSHFIKEQ